MVAVRATIFFVEGEKRWDERGRRSKAAIQASRKDVFGLAAGKRRRVFLAGQSGPGKHVRQLSVVRYGIRSSPVVGGGRVSGCHDLAISQFGRNNLNF